MEVAQGQNGCSEAGNNAANGVGWTGLTIKEILEKVDLFNITIDDGDSSKSEKVIVGKQGNNSGGIGGSNIDKVRHKTQ